MPQPSSTALPIAHAGLRLLIVLNWLYGAVVLALLIAMIISERWTLTALGFALSPDNVPLSLGVRAIAALGVVTVPFNYGILKRLAAMVETVRAGDPFVAANAGRLQAVAWMLLVLQLLSLIISAIANAISAAGHPLHLDAGFSTSGWLAVLMTFILAQVFAEGTRLREDLEGTV